MELGRSRMSEERPHERLKTNTTSPRTRLAYSVARITKRGSVGRECSIRAPGEFISANPQMFRPFHTAAAPPASA
jgi:hypothetical protein